MFNFGKTNTSFGGQPASSNTGFPFNNQQQQQQQPLGGAGCAPGASTATQGGGFGFNQGTAAPGGGAGQSTGGLFGSNTSTNATAGTGGGLFGSSNQTMNIGTTNTASGGLFGAKPATGAPGSGLFGSNTGIATNTTTGGGLFGSKPAGITTAAPGSLGGGLFGAKPAGAAPSATATGGGLFGGANATAPTPTTGGGLFGAKPLGTTTGGGLFGNSAAGNTTLGGTGSSLFGNTQSSTLGGGVGLFGGQQQQQQQSVQQSAIYSISQLPITPMTRIIDLPPALRQEIEQLDQFIQKQVQISQHLKADEEEHMSLVQSIPRDITYLSKNQSITKQTLSQDLRKIAFIKETTDQSISNTQQFTILFQQLLTPDSKVSSIELDKFFQQKIQLYQKKLDDYFRVLSDIESTVNGINDDLFGTGSNTHEASSDGPNLYALKNGLNALVATVIEEFKLFMDTAERVAELHQKVKEYTVGNSLNK
ncbi:hypothetical protein Kpol_274p8 [Vanderwaltozyma polyspora DSM 70294]|uniref:Nucleoporin Nup54 alpha-helical domain-containing protein n=1 Tax=Vanderwaltozyma polyspora (strain ATCC 22028 / DSM 70294 / BCRC 21397 / CBS 2163 / NBRC 10782 / NRRL Y-8283 / UCD 57-17) TaxID=436907 RepID=A7TT89_VANPO|nr:uncharacterized protein Kpol_274p8 [Vanderwaltozyma polyspora DSM 70294]EDO14525.1 hypothetical protein Kpol_274p8 [Vanderwaltozyma polyspora DSM 70294]